MQLNEKAVFLPSLTSKVKKNVTVWHAFYFTYTFMIKGKNVFLNYLYTTLSRSSS